ncbi:MAG: serine/threonine protein kinase, partial [Polyangiaceae bacterium]|nr:serine/threonine protein kinase [Polyangiaceae bacterium]
MEVLKPAAGGAERESALRAPLDRALGDQIRELDVTLCKAYRILAIGGVLAGLFVGAVLHLQLGFALAPLSAAAFVWFTIEQRMLPGPHGAIALLVGTAIEAALPPLCLAAVAVTQGPEYALGSFVLPMLYACVLLASTARLRPITPLFVGAATAVSFLVLYFAWLHPALGPGAADKPLLLPPMQISRSIAFMVGGGLAWLVTRALKRAIGRAERAVRSQDLFGKYRLGPRIGAGGMGVVHEALYCPEGGFERVVAIKLLHPHLADQPSFVEAFRREAELCARLVHPNIVQVLDLGRAADSYFLVLEHVEGMTLAAFMRKLASRRVELQPDVVAWIGGEVLEGLAFAHADARDAKGDVLRVVHRDLCPANVLVSSTGEVKVSDFGVARALGDATLVATTTIAGHAGYMAPEQVRAEPLDPRCDLFGAAVMLWELLAGGSLFQKETDAATVLAIVEGEVRPITLVRPDLDRAWDAFFATALARARSDRFASAYDMRAALERLRSDAKSRRDEVAELLDLARNVEEGAPPPRNTAATFVDSPLAQRGG